MSSVNRQGGERYDLVRKDGSLEKLARKLEPRPKPKQLPVSTRFGWMLYMLPPVAAGVVMLYKTNQYKSERAKVLGDDDDGTDGVQHHRKPNRVERLKVEKPQTGVSWRTATYEERHFVGFEGNEPVGMNKGEVRAVVNDRCERVEITSLSPTNRTMITTIDFDWIERNHDNELVFNEHGYPVIRGMYRIPHYLISKAGKAISALEEFLQVK